MPATRKCNIDIMSPDGVKRIWYGSGGCKSGQHHPKIEEGKIEAAVYYYILELGRLPGVTHQHQCATNCSPRIQCYSDPGKVHMAFSEERQIKTSLPAVYKTENRNIGLRRSRLVFMQHIIHFKHDEIQTWVPKIAITATESKNCIKLLW